MEEYYRFVVGEKGIYESVEKCCPKNDPRRKNKPDGSWLPRVGLNYPGAISFWTKKGLQKYIESGLLKWHTSVVKEVNVLIISKPKKILYGDELQIIVNPQDINLKRKESFNKFLNL